MSRPHDSVQTETHLSTNYQDETPVEAVVTAVAETTGQSPLEMTPIGEIIDTDALNTLFGDSEEVPSSITVTFDYCGHRVRLTTNGVQIDTPDAFEE